jgi:hypothetical protein
VSRVQVYILTTEGPSAVQRLVEEDPDVRSVVCLNGTTEALPISAAYDAFVRTPTGVIERHYGHPVYRMDVSERITEGKSWQFGVLAAHLLHAAGRLAGSGEKTDIALLVTGEVDRDLNVLPVDHVPEKLRAAQPLIASLAEQGITTLVTIPAGNETEARQAASTGLDLQPISKIDALCEGLDLPVPGEKTVSPPPQRRSFWLTRTTIALLVISGASALFLSGGPSGTTAGSRTTVSKPAQPPLSVTLFELRPPAESNCAGVRFGVAQAVPVKIEPVGPGQYRSGAPDRLCGVELRASPGSASDAPRLSATLLSGGLVGEQAVENLPGERAHQGQDTRWRMRFSRRLRDELHYRVTVTNGADDSAPLVLEHKIAR